MTTRTLPYKEKSNIKCVPLVLEQRNETINSDLEKALTKKLKGKSHHLGGRVFVSVHPKYRVVDIRHFWMPKESKQKHVALKRNQKENYRTQC